jgi:catechol 2,3-dioxygenase-like lactoylglutathione lyase family enzyme
VTDRALVIGDLVPEFAVRDLDASLGVYRLLGFEVAYDRPEERFAFLRLGGAQLMLYQIGVGRVLAPHGASLDRPLGRGVNLQIKVPAAAPLAASLEGAGLVLHTALEERWYRAGPIRHGVRQFVVADPDGYLLRLAEDLGTVEDDPGEGLAA